MTRAGSTGTPSTRVDGVGRAGTDSPPTRENPRPEAGGLGHHTTSSDLTVFARARARAEADHDAARCQFHVYERMRRRAPRVQVDLTDTLRDKHTDAWSAAAEHILDDERLPVIPVEPARALWRNGGTDRALVSRIAEAGGVR